MNKGRVIVKEAMRMKPVTVKPTDSVKQAALLMKEHKIGSCIVLLEKPIGIVTESDIVRKVVSEGKNGKDIKVSEIMSAPLMVIDPYISLEEAAKTMGKCNIRRLPIIEKDELIGIITEKDITRISPILHEITKEWYDVSRRDEIHYKQQIFSGKCEDCSTLSSRLKNIDGRILCEDCIDALKYE
jgi:CBS domain-containing protein